VGVVTNWKELKTWKLSKNTVLSPQAHPHRQVSEEAKKEEAAKKEAGKEASRKSDLPIFAGIR
jgi:hypothetical protein